MSVIVYPRGQLTDADREAMKEAGIVAVEADDPSAVVVVAPSAPMVSGDALLLAALDGLVAGNSDYSRSQMVFALHRMLNKDKP